jgi:hypothetical protein
MKTQIFSPCKNYIIFKKSSKRNQNPSRYYNSITNLKFQHKPRYLLFKNPHIKIDLLLPRGQKSLKLLQYSIMNLNTISSQQWGKKKRDESVCERRATATCTALPKCMEATSEIKKGRQSCRNATSKRFCSLRHNSIGPKEK